MAKTILKAFNTLTDYKVSKALLSLKFEGYLLDTGWLNSFRSQMPVDLEQKPLPWVTYPFIDFIVGRLHKDMRIFEYGSGNSTLFYAERVHEVHAVEHNMDWYSKISKSLPNNAKIYHKELIRDGEYARFATSLNTQFDIIVVDGRDRVNCCFQSLMALRDGGVIVLDDSEREEYKPGIDFLKDKGFKEIPFWGMAPGLNMRKCTTIFYKTDNCLGI